MKQRAIKENLELSLAEQAAMSTPDSKYSELEKPIFQALDAKDKDASLQAIDQIYGDSLYRFVRGMMGDAHTADDVYQIILVQIYRDLYTFGRRSSIRSWLFSIARYRSLDALKAQRRRMKKIAPSIEGVDIACESSRTEFLENMQLQETLEVCLSLLNPKMRAAVLKRYQENMSYKEIASAGEEKATAVRARVSRALQVLRQCIQKKGTL